jgi:hypothetical protein
MASRLPQEVLHHIASFGGIDVRIAFRIPPGKVIQMPQIPIYPPSPWPNSSEVGIAVWKCRDGDWLERGFTSNYLYYRIVYCTLNNKRFIKYRPPRDEGDREVTIEWD